jgi:2-polyprenyl-3-methyl-5-hydroxy-6-metoxy-1,4-benzoquinol methylase
MGLFYDPRFDLGELGNEVYKPKFDYSSPHQVALDSVPAGARVLDLGCGRGHVAKALKDKGCHVVGVDLSVDPANCDEALQHDLNQGLPDLGGRAFDHILLLDVIEHLNEPEAFVDQLKSYLGRHPQTRLIVSTGNIAFLPLRLSLLLGGFNYGKRGILDMTHTRLFTEKSLKRLFEDRGFRCDKTMGLPAPFPLALGPGHLADFLLWSNELAIKLLRRVFSYQVLLEMTPAPDLDWLLEKAVETSEGRRSAA